MKKTHFAFLLIFSILYSVAFAQGKAKSSSWISGKGFWNIESNIKTPRNCTIYFYNNNRDLVYKETISSKRININRKKVCKKLEAVLVQAVTAWEQKKSCRENEALVAKRF